MIKKNLIGAAIVLSLGFTGAAHAFSIAPIFAGHNDIGGFDWAPGNALAVSSLGAAAGASNTVYSEASLSSYFKTSTGTYSDTNLGVAYDITYVIAFGETTMITPIGGGAVATLAFAAGGPNYFQMFYNTGSGIGDDIYNDGTLILEGTIVADDGLGTTTAGSFFIPSFASAGDIDQNPPNNMAPGFVNKKTAIGSGSNTAVIKLNAVQGAGYASFFNGLDLNALSVLGSDARTPFTTADPLISVSKNQGAGQQAENLPTVNGNPTCAGASDGIPGTPEKECDFLFQNDSNNKFNTVAAPEPGTLALMGLGLLGMGMARRKKSA